MRARLGTAVHFGKVVVQWSGFEKSREASGVSPCISDNHALLAGFREDKNPDALTPNSVELIPTLGAISPEAGPSRGRLDLEKLLE